MMVKRHYGKALQKEDEWDAANFTQPNLNVMQMT
jgi:hypothetical protein